jgi:predicted transposase YdaD
LNNALTLNFVLNLEKLPQTRSKTVYGDETLKKTAVYDWFKRFKNGQESLEDEERSGRPSTSKNDETIEKVKNLVRSHRRLRIQDMANVLGISYGSVQNILKDDLGMRRVVQIVTF